MQRILTYEERYPLSSRTTYFYTTHYKLRTTYWVDIHYISSELLYATAPMPANIRETDICELLCGIRARTVLVKRAPIFITDPGPVPQTLQSPSAPHRVCSTHSIGVGRGALGGGGLSPPKFLGKKAKEGRNRQKAIPLSDSPPLKPRPQILKLVYILAYRCVDS